MLDVTNKKRVGIIRGGKGRHYESSLSKGGDIISHIFENLSDKYEIVDILIDKNGNWYTSGIPINPVDLPDKVDLIWNTSKSHSLPTLSIPSIGNEFFFKAMDNNNEMFRNHIKDIDIKMPRSVVIPTYQKDFDGPLQLYAVKKAKEVFEKFSSPWIVKSYTQDSNMGIHLAKTFPELVDAIQDGVIHNKSILIEEFISGKIAGVHSVTQFRGQDIYVFPPSNLSAEQTFFTTDEKEEIISLVKELHKHLGVEHYLKSDFILNPKRGLFLFNIDLLPDPRKGSQLDESCEFVGVKMHHLIEHILESALDKSV